MNSIVPFSAMAALAFASFAFTTDDGGSPDDLRARLVAHKGECGDAPENTMESFRLAADRGFGFELDVALSRDGKVFVFHDSDFSRLTGGACAAKPSDLDWADIARLDVSAYAQFKDSRFSPQRPPLLEEALELARDGRFVYVDVAGPEIVPALKAVFEAQSKATSDNSLFISSDKDACRALKRAFPGWRTLWITSGRHWEKPGHPPVTAEEMLDVIRATGADGVDCHYDPGVVTEAAVAAVHDAGFGFHVWTVDDVDAAAEVFRRGVDTLTTNYADRLFRGLSASAGVSFGFATWNVGHWSCGRTYPSDISPEQFGERMERYSAFLDRAAADVVGICEDSWFCDAASTRTAREAVFGRYAWAANERERPFDYNSLYWNGAECLESGRVVFPQAADKRFYRWARLRIAGRKVVVVEAHLDWNITPPGHYDDRRLQIRKLIEDFKDEPCVVIGGDFNTSLSLPGGEEVDTPEDYEAFRAAGYSAAHWGSIATWPADKPVLTIDNVFAKGLDISGVEALADPILSDHALLRCTLSFPAIPPRGASPQQASRKEPAKGFMSPGGDMSEDDFGVLSEWGAKLLRFQMVRDWHAVDGNRDLDEYERWLNGRLDHFERAVLPEALKRGLRVVLDLHVPPGGRDAGGESNLFYDPGCADRFVETWRKIARRFRGRYGIYGYDLLNEPCHKREPAPGCSWREVALHAARAIREEDPWTAIVFEPNLWAGPEAFADLEPLPVDGVVYETHFYEPFEFTHQRVLGTRPWTLPWPCSGKGWDKAFLEAALKSVRDFQLRTGARIYVGEFSAVCWAPGAENWIRDCTALFREWGWDWTWHAFREWPGWSVEHESDGPADDAPETFRPSADNPRKRALLEALRL